MLTALFFVIGVMLFGLVIMYFIAKMVERRDAGKKNKV